MFIISETNEILVSKYKDEYIIKNKSLLARDFSIEQLNCGQSVKKVKNITLSPGEEESIKFNYDSFFGIFIDNSDDMEVSFPVYTDTLNIIVHYTEKYLCGCDCAGCEECDDKEELELPLKTLSLMLSYLMASNPIYTKYFNIVSNILKCDINFDLICQINNLSLKGNSDSKFFIKRLIAYLYLIFYLQESLQAVDKEEAEYIKEKFNYSTIEPCIRKLGINPKDLIEELLSGMEVKYWQYRDLVSNINTVINAWTPNYLNTLPGIDFRPLEDFEQGVTIPYTQIGRIGFAIAPSQLLNFTIYDSLGNDVTDNFDTHYFSDDETVVFISKVPYSHSNIYFKFKKNVYA